MARSLCRVAPVLLCCLLCFGCSTAKRIASDGAARWSGLGLSLTLPPGQWRAEVLEKDRYASLDNETTGGSLLVVRLEAPEDLSPAVAIRKLFAAFDKKELRAETPFALSDGGAQGVRSEYDVEADGKTRRVVAVAFRKDSRMYDVAGWGMDRADFDAVTASLSVSEGPP